MKINKAFANVFTQFFVLVFLTISLLVTLVQASASEKDAPPSILQNSSNLTSDIDQWIHVIGEARYQYANDVIQTNDGNLVFVGYTDVNNGEEGLGDGWIAKYTVGGELIWQKTIGTENGDSFSSVKETSDGNIVVIGSSYYKGWIVKLDTGGNLIWQRGIIAAVYDDIEETSDGGLVILGRVYTRVGDAVVVKTNSLGDVEWQITYGTSATDGGNDIIQTSDNGYIVVGYLGTGGAWVMSLKNDGTINWQKDFIENGIGNSATSVTELSDNSIIVGGYVNPDSANTSAWIANIELDGTVNWQKIFSGLGTSYIRALQQTTDGGLILVGEYTANAEQALIIKTDNTGTIEWQKGINVGPSSERFIAVQQSTDNDFIAAGWTANNNTFDMDILLVKLDNLGKVDRCPLIQDSNSIAQAIDFPYVDGSADAISSTPTAIAIPAAISESSLPLKVTCPYPPISISKSGPTSAIGGCPITYTLTITNNMASSVTGVLITDTVPLGANYLGGGSLNNNVVKWTIPILSAGESSSQEFSVEATQMITNHDYWVSTSEGYSTKGQIPVITSISNLVFLPVSLNNYCGNFFDDFSNPSSGWYVNDDAYVRSEYLNGEFRVLSKQSGYVYVYSAPGCAREYYSVAADVRWAANKGAEYGLLLGINNGFDEYYMFLVSADYQDYGLLKRTSNGWVSVVDFTPNNAIHQGTSINHLEAVYQNGDMILKVNGVTLGVWFVGYANMPTWAGIVSHPYENMPTSDARFDNFSVQTVSSTSQVNSVNTSMMKNSDTGTLRNMQSLLEWNR